MIGRREFISLLGGAATSPVAARAQQPAMPVVGFLGSRSPTESSDVVAGFRKRARRSWIRRGTMLSSPPLGRGSHYEQLPTRKFENEQNNQDQKATSCCGNPLLRHELPSSPLGKRAAPPVIWQQPSAPRDIRVA